MRSLCGSGCRSVRQKTESCLLYRRRNRPGTPRCRENTCRENIVRTPKGRRCSRNHLTNVTEVDFDCIGVPSECEQYFPGTYSLGNEECLVDCGAYTGDTIQSFVAQTDNRFRKVIAFEADPAVMSGLQRFVSNMGTRARLHNAAVGGQNGVVHFAGDGIGGGRITDAASATGTAVNCVRLDDALADERATLIKMDIEGAELQALEGAHRVIWRDRPVLAVCGYHKPDHLWRVLVSLKTLAPDS